MLIDTHCHLDEDAFSGDRGQCLERARDAGVMRVITIGTTLNSAQKAIELAEQNPMVFAAIGIHPNYAAVAGEDDWAELINLAAHPRVVGIGETGLDHDTVERRRLGNLPQFRVLLERQDARE